MAVPSSLILDPNTKEEGYSEFDSTLTGSNIFERPSYTDRELFTQSGTDAPASDWKDGAVQGDGYIGKCFDSDGVDDWIERTMAISTGKYSFSLWINHNTALPTGFRPCFALKHATQNSFPATFTIRSDGLFQVYHSIYGGSNAWVRYDGLSDYRGWHHLFIMWEGTATTPPLFYIDGVQKSIDSVSGTFNSHDAAADVQFGRFDYGGDSFDGKINNFYYKSNSMSEADRLAYSNAPTVAI